jgi:hypothetical protein
MARPRTATTQEIMRLDAIAKHLGIKSRYPQSSFTSDVGKACVRKIAPVIDKMSAPTGEVIAFGLAEHLHLKFEEVRQPRDVDELEHRYLKGKKEIGFAQLRTELAQPGCDALLFERINAAEHDTDKWVAVLNLQQTEAKAYWNRFHELAHRIAEPPQQILPFKRHQFEASNPVEALIDSVAAEFAFYPPAVRPMIEIIARHGELNFAMIDSFLASYAPTASLLATMKAVVKFWPRPAAAISAEVRGRKGAASVDQALRVTIQGYSETANDAGVTFIPNMRVPSGSPMYTTFYEGGLRDDREALRNWVTSDGSKLRDVNVHTSSRRMGSVIYSVMSM